MLQPVKAIMSASLRRLTLFLILTFVPGRSLHHPNLHVVEIAHSLAILVSSCANLFMIKRMVAVKNSALAV